MAGMYLRPLTLAEANAFVTTHHRHNKKVTGHRFSVGLFYRYPLGFFADTMIGCVIVGRPVARGLDQVTAVEVTRCCVSPGSPKGACSMLYRAAWRAWKEMGGTDLYTYTLTKESGASLRGAGFELDAVLQPRAEAGWTNREGREAQAVVGEAKYRWRISVKKETQ